MIFKNLRNRKDNQALQYLSTSYLGIYVFFR